MESYILVAVGEAASAEVSLRELSELLDTAGGETADCVIQSLPHPDPATYLGSGKAEELRCLLEEEEETQNRPLSPPASPVFCC